MLLLEYQAKTELSKMGVAVPEGAVARTPEEASGIAAALGRAVVVKAQVPAGGRGKAGAIRLAQSPDEAARAAEEILGRRVGGHLVDCVLVEEKLPIQQELYLSIVFDAAHAGYTVLFSTQGGMDIEELAAAHPESIQRLALDPFSQLDLERAASLLQAGGLEAPHLSGVQETLLTLYRLFREKDLLLAEINPLALGARPWPVAVDFKMEVDDDALFRHPEYIPIFMQRLDERERIAHELGISFVALDGDIGVIASGAGLGMATLDLLQREGLRPANFLDTGGGITEKLMYRAVRLVMEPAGVRGGLINLYGGINPMVEAAQGIVAALQDMPVRKPIVVKLVGNRQEEAWAILEGAGVPVVKTVRTEEAAALLARLLRPA